MNDEDIISQYRWRLETRILIRLATIFGKSCPTTGETPFLMAHLAPKTRRKHKLEVC